MKTAEEILHKKGNEMFSVPHDTTICAALKVMREKRIGAILVTRDENIIGIWTERDLMINCLKDGFNTKKELVGDHMSPDLQTAKYNESIFGLMDKFLGKRMRHLLIEKGGKFIGILSSGDVIRATLSAKDEELKRLNAIASWEYYEHWSFQKNITPPKVHQEGLRLEANPVD